MAAPQTGVRRSGGGPGRGADPGLMPIGCLLHDEQMLMSVVACCGIGCSREVWNCDLTQRCQWHSIPCAWRPRGHGWRRRAPESGRASGLWGLSAWQLNQARASGNAKHPVISVLGPKWMVRPPPNAAFPRPHETRRGLLHTRNPS